MTRFESLRADWLSVEEASSRILARAERTSVVRMALGETLGHALAGDLTSEAVLPPWDNSAMDGYAIQGADIEGATQDSPVPLTVVGEVVAGARPSVAVGPGEAVKIMTGAPVPEGADTVVRVEHTDAEVVPGTVNVRASSDAGRNVRPGGEDMRPGDQVLAAGTTIGAGQAAVLSALGLAHVEVHRPTKVALLANGDELAPIERFADVRAGNAVPETNTHAAAMASREVGAVPMRLGIARDNEEDVERHVRRALDSDADVLVTLAGASMGETDLFKRVLGRFDFRLDFWRVRMRPGSPLSFGELPRSEGRRPLPVFGLPGNPASTFVTFHLFVRPYLLAAAGHTRIQAPVITATAATPLSTAPHLAQFVRVRLAGAGTAVEAYSAGPQGSGLISGLGHADGLAVIPEGQGRVEIGDALDVILLGAGQRWGPDAGYVANPT